MPQSIPFVSDCLFQRYFHRRYVVLASPVQVFYIIQGIQTSNRQSYLDKLILSY